ncbi:FISUMP domain-containing protein, partial [Fibrobacter sp. HC4]|uniref:FISUMP domain-containing protein n=1 Tax=Fibrobacter sp. HC4 TaxID=3239812 RepID=UPI0023DF9723
MKLNKRPYSLLSIPSESSRVILSAARSAKSKNLGMLAFAFVLLALTACTSGLEDDYEEMYGYLVNGSVTPSVVEGSMTDSRDGQTYKTVTIGTQTWMAENLNYAYVKHTAEEDSSSFCYDNNPDNCAKYGRLYLWSAAMDSAAVFSTAGKGCGYGKTCSPSGTVRGVCPEGWHLPNDDEWNTLWTAVGGTSTAVLKLKSTSGWSGGGDGSDSFGFAVLPAGRRYNSGSFYDEGYDANFWSSTEYDSYYAYGWFFNYNYGSVLRDNSNEGFGFSVRCLRDSDEGGEASSSSSQAQPTSSSSSVTPSEVEGSMTDSRDGQTYKTVTIGTQTWMAENLNYDYNEGTAKSYCYEDNTANCDKYGRLYLWSAAMDSAAVFSTAGKGCGYGKTCSPSGTVRGVCPEGWHLPNDDEWNTLWTAVGGTSTAG